MSTQTDRPGRRPVTSAAELGSVALDLFLERGFDATTIDDIAAACDIGRRTFFRYFPSKNDVVWGEFDHGLDRMRDQLAAISPAIPLRDALVEAIVDFNRVPEPFIAQHRSRMNLILRVPALQAHSTLRYAEWRSVIAGFVADRRGESAEDAMPQLVAHVALAACVAAYERWLADVRSDLATELRQSLVAALTGFPDLDHRV